MQRIQRPKMLVEMATEAIRDMIVSGRLQLGERLSENRLAEVLGISTTPVREAFSKLAHEGLLDVVPQTGTFVFTLQPGEINHLCELRVALEPAALQLAYERGRTSLIDALIRVVGDMDAAMAKSEIARYLALDSAFHRAIIDGSGNAYIRQAYDLIAAKVATLRLRLGTDPHHVAKSYREHREILEAIRRDDIDGALAILPRHIARKEGSYWEHLDGGLLRGKLIGTRSPVATTAVPPRPSSRDPRKSSAS